MHAHRGGGGWSTIVRWEEVDCWRFAFGPKQSQMTWNFGPMFFLDSKNLSGNHTCGPPTSVDQTRFSVSVEVSLTGAYSIFTMDIPRQFADLNTCVFLESNQNFDQDESAITAGFRQVQDQILRAFADLTNIRPAEQVDPLPFPCDQSRKMISFSIG